MSRNACRKKQASFFQRNRQLSKWSESKRDAQNMTSRARLEPIHDIEPAQNNPEMQAFEEDEAK